MKFAGAWLTFAILGQALSVTPVAAKATVGRPLIGLKYYTPCNQICTGAFIYDNDTIDVSGLVTHRIGTKYLNRFRLKPAAFAEFRRLLNTVRPRGYRRINEVCAPDRGPDAKPDDIDVHWYDEPPARLTACFEPGPVTETVNAAKEVLSTANPLNNTAAAIARARKANRIIWH